MAKEKTEVPPGFAVDSNHRIEWDLAMREQATAKPKPAKEEEPVDPVAARLN